MIEIVPATPAHVGTIAARMREIDRLECRLMGHTPKQALRMGLRYSTLAWTAKVDGVPQAMFGVSVVSLVGGEGSPWLLLTSEGEKCARYLVREGRRYSDAMQAAFPLLSNRVHADNHKAIRWLSRLGYAIDDKVDMSGMRRFERRGEPSANRLAC